MILKSGRDNSMRGLRKSLNRFMINTYGSLCSGIEAASLVLEPLNKAPLWLSEIADFPSRFLEIRYPHIPNLGDMNGIPDMILRRKVDAPDMLCGGTPCQAFSLAGWRNGINDDRGQLTLKYIDIVNAIDSIRLQDNKNRTVFFWENVEGALTDKTNAFGCFLAGLLGLENTIYVKKWTNAGVAYGKERNVAWRVLDAKYFGLPQQRRRVYLLGGGKDFHPEKVLLEQGAFLVDPFKEHSKTEHSLSLFGEPKETVPANFELEKEINGNHVEAFRSYSDCLYAAYGTKWNGNAAAFNGSLYFSQDGRLRRLSPLECERLMGFPDNYTLLDKCKDTLRYQAVGNSWAVPVVKWICNKLDLGFEEPEMPKLNGMKIGSTSLTLLDDFTPNPKGGYINASKMPYDYKLANMLDIVDTETPEKFYITSKGCEGILRRKHEQNARMNARLEAVLRDCSIRVELKESHRERRPPCTSDSIWTMTTTRDTSSTSPASGSPLRARA